MNRCHRCGASWEGFHACFSDRPALRKAADDLHRIVDTFRNGGAVSHTEIDAALAAYREVVGEAK